MINFPTEGQFEDGLTSEILNNLELRTEGVGIPSTSVFGIKIDLLGKGCVVSEAVVDFIDKTFD